MEEYKRLRAMIIRWAMILWMSLVGALAQGTNPPLGGFDHSVGIVNFKPASPVGHPVYVFPDEIRMPAYPQRWLEARLQGTVVVEFQIDEQGRTGKYRYVSSDINDSVFTGKYLRDSLMPQFLRSAIGISDGSGAHHRKG